MPETRECGACLRAPPAFDAALAAVDYAFPWDLLLARFKFRSQPELAHALAQRIVAVIEQARPPAPDLVVPVPSSAQRLRERGYSPAWELARRVGALLGIEAAADVLAHGRDSAHQVGLSRSQRLANLRHAVWVDPAAATRLRERRVALVDDVMTTGATAEQCTQALLRAGAADVQVWVLTRTPAH